MGYVEGDEDEGTGTRRPSEQFRAAGVGDASAPSAEACVPGGDAGDGSGVPFLMSALADGTNRCDAGCMARKMPHASTTVLMSAEAVERLTLRDIWQMAGREHPSLPIERLNTQQPSASLHRPTTALTPTSLIFPLLRRPTPNSAPPRKSVEPPGWACEHTR